MSGKKMMDADRLETLIVRLHCACTLLGMVHGIVESQPATAADALYSVLDAFNRIHQDFETEIEKADSK